MAAASSSSKATTIAGTTVAAGMPGTMGLGVKGTQATGGIASTLEIAASGAFVRGKSQDALEGSVMWSESGGFPEEKRKPLPKFVTAKEILSSQLSSLKNDLELSKVCEGCAQDSYEGVLRGLKS